MSDKKSEKFEPVELRGPGVDAWNGLKEGDPIPFIVPISLPEGFEIGEFKPCVIYVEGLKLTQMLLEDAMIVWCPWRGTRGMGHAVDLGYHAETGKLVGIQIWDDVGERPKE